MNPLKLLFVAIIVSLTVFSCAQQEASSPPLIKISDPRFVIHTIDLSKQDLKFYWQSEAGQAYRSFQNLKSDIAKQGKKLVFAMNGGMYQKDGSPQGLYIENGKILSPLEKREAGYGNFYLQPNGVFYLTDDKQASVCKSTDFNFGGVQYATQSGPLLVINGQLHPKLTKGSKNLHIRNAVGILPNGNILFVMSKAKINFYDLATFFKDQGCQNALYLDGFVSRAYLPSEDWKQLDGNFGVIIAETK